MSGKGWPKGRPFTPEHRANVSAGKRGIKPSAETRAKMSANHAGGRKRGSGHPLAAERRRLRIKLRRNGITDPVLTQTVEAAFP